jgi:protein-S-isoprenylcysteine O-methyltransferase Ste14
VTTGVFGWIRHPIYATQACLMAGTAVLVPSPLMVGLTFVHATALGAKAAIEERHLIAVHGVGYREYMHRCGRFFPRPGL